MPGHASIRLACRIYARGCETLLQAGDCPELVRGLVREKHSFSWFALQGDRQVVLTTRGTRPGECLSGSMFSLLFSRMLGRRGRVGRNSFPSLLMALPLWWNRYSAICWRPSDVHPCSIGFASRPGGRSCRGSNYGRTSSHAVSANIGPRETAAMLSPSGAGDRAVRPPRCATCWSFSRGDQGLESSSSRLSMTSVAFAVDAMSLSDFACIAVAIPAPPLACTPFWAMPSCSLRVQRAHPAWLNCVLTCISATFGFAPRGRPCVICVALSRDQGGKLFEWLEQEAALSASSHPWLCFTREPNRTWNHRKERKSCTPSVPSTLRYNLGSLNPKPQAQNPKP